MSYAAVILSKNASIADEQKKTIQIWHGLCWRAARRPRRVKINLGRWRTKEVYFRTEL